MSLESRSAASFLNYTPVPLTFGTSGLRGLVKDITDLEAYINVKATLRYFLGIGDIDRGSTVVIAGDLRPSTERIMRACARAVIDCDCALEHAGRIPTPALISYTMAARRAGLMVTGSHIPFDRNGIKLNKSSGEVLKADEAGITREIEQVRLEEYGRTAATSLFDLSGMLKEAPKLPQVNPAAEEAYVRRYVQSFRAGDLSGLRVLVYQHSAVARDILPRILRDLGADVVSAGRSDMFVPIDTENVTDEQLDRLETFAVSETRDGQPLHAIVSTDGDSDRPLVAAVLSDGQIESGARHVRFVPGDLLGIIVAEYLQADAAAVPISANDAVDIRLGERGVSLKKTKIGSPYVISAIDEIRREGKHRRIVGWEANGGFLTGSDFPLDGGALTALPTRDSALPIVASLCAAVSQHLGLARLCNQLPARFGHAGLLDNVPLDVSRAILDHITPPGPAIEAEFDSAGRVLDCSGTAAPGALLPEPLATQWRDRKAILERFFLPAFGFDIIARINAIDGVRVYFRNGDVAHVRPSGNAPQLRVYSSSNSQNRATEIVELGVREPDGILRKMEREFT